MSKTENSSLKTFWRGKMCHQLFKLLHHNWPLIALWAASRNSLVFFQSSLTVMLPHHMVSTVSSPWFMSLFSYRFQHIPSSQNWAVASDAPVSRTKKAAQCGLSEWDVMGRNQQGCQGVGTWLEQLFCICLNLMEGDKEYQYNLVDLWSNSHQHHVVSAGMRHGNADDYMNHMNCSFDIYADAVSLLH